MGQEEFGREQVARELDEIRAKLADLSGRAEFECNLQNELTLLGLRVERLAADLIRKSQEDSAAEKVVLVVDDNDELRTFIKHALALSDYTVLEAQDGEEAVSILQEAKKLDLVICDVILPGMKGPELLKKIRGMFPGVNVIIMSGYVSDGIISQDVEQTMASGGIFMQKPFSTRTLLETVHETLSK